MLINLSNHPSAKWSTEQYEVGVKDFGEIVDLPFPAVDPDCDVTRISKMADEYFNKCVELANGKQFSVHLMGEMTLTFAILKRLQNIGVKVVAATTERIVVDGDGQKTVVFNFVRFREYEK